jgi:hypothetical protein
VEFGGMNEAMYNLCARTEQNDLLLAPFLDQHDQFAKIGSGPTQGKS